MRHDSLGMFWLDEPVIKIKKEKPKRNPPDRTWELPTYLPNLEEALRFPVSLYTDNELIHAAMVGERLIYDIECYPNYFLIAFKGEQTNKVTYVEFDEQGFGHILDNDMMKLDWIMRNFCIVSFNGINYDMPMTALALNGLDVRQLKRATDMIITGVDGDLPKRPQDVLKHFKTKFLKGINHIDLIEVAPLQGALKIYAGRLHAPRMQDLPFHPSTVLSTEQKAIVRWYCVNDLTNTDLLYKSLKQQVQLRESMGKVYNLDLRSKSDAQIAEAVIAEEMRRQSGYRPKAPVIEIGANYSYHVPSFIKYHGMNMNWVLNVVKNATFYVTEQGRIGMPVELSDLDIPIGNGVYRMGIGGLHSSEKKAMHRADGNTILVDRDVVSYYPSIILNQGLYPQHLGVNFLTVYNNIVQQRLSAKRSGDKVTADSLKITINGSFGKLGSKYSILYSPDLLIQVTITGQLALLMLIERLEVAGIPVVSANTDGVVIKCPKVREEDMNAIVKQWEADTGFETEEARYAALYSRDVNNYIAVKTDGKTKTKGAYADIDLKKNPQNEVCVDAVIALLTKGVPVEASVRNCKDITKFVAIRQVRGGAVKNGEYLGKTIRWYHAANEEGEIVYALNGNKVPMTDGARPLMDLPSIFPSDVDYDWYIEESFDILRDIGYMS